MIKAALSVLSSFLPSLAFSYIVAACLPACICICFTMKDEFSENRKKFVPKSLNYLYLLPNNLTFIQASKILKVQSCSLKKIHCCFKKKNFSFLVIVLLALLKIYLITFFTPPTFLLSYVLFAAYYCFHAVSKFLSLPLIVNNRPVLISCGFNMNHFLLKRLSNRLISLF